MADVIGARTTGNILQDIRRVDMKETVLELEPNAAPLTLLSSKLGTDTCHNPEFSWTEDDRMPRFDAVNGTTGTGADIVVDNADRFGEHAIWKNTRTGENMRVLSVNTVTSTVTFQRAVGTGESAVAVANNDELMHIGWAQPENDNARPARSNNPTKVTNYTQIVRHTVEASRTSRRQATYTKPKDWARQVGKIGLEHKLDHEYIYLHGKPSEVTTSEGPRRTTGGAYHFVQTNVTHAGGQLTEAEFFGAFSNLFRYGSQDTKVAFASRLAVDVINGFPRGKLEAVQSDNDTTYGLKVMTYRSPHGDLRVMTHNLLEGDVFGGHILVLDMTQIRKRVLADEEGSDDMTLNENIQPRDQDGRMDEYLSETGLEFGLEQAHGYIDGITS